MRGRASSPGFLPRAASAARPSLKPTAFADCVDQRDRTAQKNRRRGLLTPAALFVTLTLHRVKRRLGILPAGTEQIGRHSKGIGERKQYRRFRQRMPVFNAIKLHPVHSNSFGQFVLRPASRRPQTDHVRCDQCFAFVFVNHVTHSPIVACTLPSTNSRAYQRSDRSRNSGSETFSPYQYQRLSNGAKLLATRSLSVVPRASPCIFPSVVIW